MDMTTLTTMGGVVTSVASSFAAVLAWGAKLQFAQEFKDARDAQVTAANQIVDSVKVQKEAEIQQIKVEIQKKDVEIERLKAKIEDIERDSPKALLSRYEDMKAAYEAMMNAELQKPSLDAGETAINQEIVSSRQQFENQLEALGKEIDWMIRLSHDSIKNRKEARRWLQDNYQSLAQKAFNYVCNKHPDALEGCCDTEQKLKQFSWDLEEYLETICDCLVVDRPNLMDRQYPTIAESEPYRFAFNYIKRQVNSSIPDNVAGEIIKYLNYLLASFN